ncbi:uncharacterized protein [Watersipora subatra]|uniref:uncharacterized protein n=1 Tax=Watersipora subatra TaxID=2589382 RepID=UPI00355C4524
MACVAHFESTKGALINLTDYSASVLHNSVHQWIELNKEPEKTVCARLKEEDLLVVGATVHKNCYSRLVNKSKLEKAKRNYSELSVADDPGDISVFPPPKKTLRSASNVKLSTSKPVLEKVCVICEKRTRYLSVKSKTVLDKLMRAETVHAGGLKNAARQKQDNRILMHFVKDPIASEMHYHKKCHRDYTYISATERKRMK